VVAKQEVKKLHGEKENLIFFLRKKGIFSFASWMMRHQSRSCAFVILPKIRTVKFTQCHAPLKFVHFPNFLTLVNAIDVIQFVWA